MRLPNSRESNPPPTRRERSGLRLSLPIALNVSIGASVFLMLAEFAEYVRSASFGPGCTPDAPFATRRRKLLIALKTLCFGKKSSSDITHDRLAFG